MKLFERNKDNPSLTIIFILAAVWNLVGAAFGYFNTEFTFQQMFNRPLNDPLFYQVYHGTWGTTLVFFIGYAMVAWNPIKHTGVAFIGGIGKLFFAIAELGLYLSGLANPIILIIVIGDFVFCILFIYYFVQLYKQRVPII